MIDGNGLRVGWDNALCPLVKAITIAREVARPSSTAWVYFARRGLRYLAEECARNATLALDALPDSGSVKFISSGYPEFLHAHYPKGAALSHRLIIAWAYVLSEDIPYAFYARFLGAEVFLPDDILCTDRSSIEDKTVYERFQAFIEAGIR
jgi:hypothetical protein